MNIYIYLKPKKLLYSIIFNIQLPQNVIHQQIFDKNTIEIISIKVKLVFSISTISISTNK